MADKKKTTTILIIGIAGIYILSLISALVILFKNTSGRENIPDVKSARETTEPSSLKISSIRKRSGGGTVALVEIYGPIRISSSRISHGTANPERITRKLRNLAADNDVKAVVLRINSPGGTVAGVQEIYEEIMNLRKNGKIVVASMGDVAASGGYYIAAAADKIVANPGTLTGSIGVIMELAQGEALFKKIGVKFETVKSGRYKDTGSWSREITSEEKQILQTLINDAYSQFVQAITDGRKIPREEVLKFADGRIFTGAQAKAIGIVDELGGKTDAIYLAASLAGIKGEPNVVVEKDPWEDFLDTFGISGGMDGSTANNSRAAAILRFLGGAVSGGNMISDGGVMASPIRFEYSMD